MKTEKNILIAFLLNFAFSVFEFVGGILTGSAAILSDAVHDVGDALSIGVSYFLERKSKREPDERYTYGYARYSVLGSVFTTLILLVGSVLVVSHAVARIVTPTPINYKGMILFALVGALVNFLAALFTRHGDSLNQKAVNLHMLEDVLGWIVVLIGAVVMHFTNFSLLDPILSIAVAVFIFVNALKTLGAALALFLERTPAEIDVSALREHLCHTEGVLDVHHLHLWSLDGEACYATMHVVADGDAHAIKKRVREELAEHGVTHATLELETRDEECHERHCHVEHTPHAGHHHHRHHSH